MSWRMLLGLLAGVAAGVALFGRQWSAPPAQAPSAARNASPPIAPDSRPSIRFTDVTGETGIRFQHENGRTGRYRYPEILGAGVALFDYDGDGDLDVYLVNGNRLGGPPDPAIHSALYRNEGGLRFTDVSQQAGVAAAGYGQGVCAGDADGDGHLDLYVTYLGKNRFFRNRGDGTFASAERQAGLEDERWGQGCAFLDYDQDGHLDLYVLNYLTYSLEMPQEREVLLGGRRLPDYLGPQPFQGSASRLFRNRGGGVFVDATRQAGVYRPGGKGMGLACVDFDGDGLTDIFQANDGIEDYLFRNLGRGRFEEIGLQAGVAVGGEGRPKGSMGVDAGDFDNDGDLDLTVPVVRMEVFGLYRNDGAYFTDVAGPSGLADASGRLTGFSGHFADFDNDGDLDLFYANGEVQSHETVGAEADALARYGTRDLLLRNDGPGPAGGAVRFSDVSGTAGPHFARALIGRGAATGDLDGDGDVDLVVSHCGGPLVVLRNDTAGGHWATLVLRDRGRNREAIGAKVWLEAAGRRQYRELQGGGGYLSTNDRRLHFGLGPATRIDRLEIRWPDGARQALTSLDADRVLRIEREAGAARHR